MVVKKVVFNGKDNDYKIISLIEIYSFIFSITKSTWGAY